MSGTTAHNDRRARSRLVAVGPLWGTLQLGTFARVANITENGALIESPLAAALGTVGKMSLALNGHEITVDVCVCHVRRTAPAGDAPRYLIGVEFLSPPPVLASLIARSSGKRTVGSAVQEETT